MMTQEYINESNKLIHDFMYPFKDKRLKTYFLPFPIYVHHDSEKIMGYGIVEAEDVKITHGPIEMLIYHQSWDWLMPAIIKMASIPLYRNGFREQFDEMYMEANPVVAFATDITMDCPLSMEILWKECVQFIKWYNVNKTK